MKAMKKTLLLLSTLSLFSCGQKTRENRITFEAMDTFMTLGSFGDNSGKANSEIKEEVERIEELISTTKESSEIHKINSSGGGVEKVSDETAFLLYFALKMANETDGALNPCLYPITKAWGFTSGDYRIPSDAEIEELLAFTDFRKASVSENSISSISIEENMKIDFGSIGKGYAADQAVKILKKNGIESAVLDFGGNVQVVGGKIGKDGKISDWAVGVQNPFGDEPLGKLSLRDKAVVTSGGYERFFIGGDGKKYIHIFDSKTGRPVENDLASVTIVADSGLYADALSTAMFAMGFDKAADFWRSKRDFQMILVTKNFGIHYTEGLDGILEIKAQEAKTGIIKTVR